VIRIKFFMMNRSSTVFFKDSSRVVGAGKLRWGAWLVISDFALKITLRVRLYLTPEVFR
jgi:hypothetical protein